MCRTELLVSDLHWISWYQLRVFGYFRSASRLWILIGIGSISLALNWYQLWVFGFDRYRLWVFGFWISWLRVFRYFRSVSTLGLWILDRYRLWVFGFD
ncbi:unnamed protein product [Rhizophagus irregularis]|nr:unnamed protein product [Rhizophagus irregularis]CAB5387010.1 unnamed protein product [Rhizophagus irregularis]